MDSLLDRFLRYVRVDTQSDESSLTYPSTTKQLTLGRMLAEECRALGFRDVSCNEHGIVMATVPGTTKIPAPTIAWIAHVDTSPEYSAEHVQPVVHPNYQGTDITLPGDPTKVIRAANNAELKACLGHTLITTDGTTLLGSDDKAGIAIIMTASAELLARSNLEHAPVRICFTCDEEIGRGTDKLDLQQLNAVCGYTLDGGGQGEINAETFSADQALVHITGVNIHPSIGKGAMVNAVRILSEFISRLPKHHLSPESTEGREGFLHPYHLEGGVAEASARIILRDFETSALSDQAQLLEQIASTLRAEYPEATISVDIRRQYRNLRDGLTKEPRVVTKAEAAFRAMGIAPKFGIIRGGTDGSLLTEKGLPTPNLSSGQHNIHSPLEWCSLHEMETAVKMLVQLAVEWGRETV